MTKVDLSKLQGAVITPIDGKTPSIKITAKEATSAAAPVRARAASVRAATADNPIIDDLFYCRKSGEVTEWHKVESARIRTLSDAVDSSQDATGTTAATPKAVKIAYDLATSAKEQSNTAKKLATAQTISLTGDVTGSANFDGSAATSIAVTVDPKFVTDEELTEAIDKVDLSNVVTLSTAQTISGAKTFSATIVANGGVSGNLTGNVTGNVSGSSAYCTGNAATATRLQTARKIALAGAVSGTASFDGTADVTITTTMSANAGGTVPTGAIIPFMGQGAVPDGYLLCNGASVSAATYPNLYAAIGTTFGGDSTNFNLPNLNGRFLEGTTSTPGAAHEAGLPNITGSEMQNVNGAEGAFYADTTRQGYTHFNGMAINRLTFSAARSSSIYGGASTVQPASYATQYLIKY